MLYFSKWVARAALVVSTMVVSAGASAQVTWSIADGKVTGVQNVNVGGSFYDVTFGRSYVPSAGFVNSTFATLASQALVDQVFTADAPLDLDNKPMYLRGCLTNWQCLVRTYFGESVYNYENEFQVRVLGIVTATNAPVYDGITVREAPGGYLIEKQINPISNYETYASWAATPVAAVPEPETYALMLAGLGLIGAIARRRRAKQA